MRYVWLDPLHLSAQYITALRNDPNKPANFSLLTSGSDGAPDAALQQFVAGVNSLCPDLRVHPTAGVSAFYVDDPGQDAVATALVAKGGKRWVNGILGGGTGEI